MQECGRVLALAHEAVEAAIRPGVTTQELDDIARRVIEENGAKPSFLGLYDYPATINASINEEVIHGIPSKKRVLREGDIIGIDIGAFKGGFHTDAARTHTVGNVSEAAERIVRVTRECFFEALKLCRVGYRISDLSHAIEAHAKAHGYSLVQDFTGHGIGRKLHEDPPVPNYGPKGHGPRLEPGMALAIEPMLNEGKHPVYIKGDGWTVVTRDSKLSAHYENTVIITEGDPLVLTLTARERSYDLADIIRV